MGKHFHGAQGVSRLQSIYHSLLTRWMLILLIALCGIQCSKSPGLNKNEQVDAK